MTDYLPEPIPRCTVHGAMTLVPDGGRTDMARWCGVWYECGRERCGASSLIPSQALLAQLAEQRAQSQT